MSERERFFIEANYYCLRRESWRRRRRPTNCGSRPTQETTVPYDSLGFIYRALETGKRHWRKPGRQCAWSRTTEPTIVNLGNAYMSLNRLDEAEAVYKQAEERKLESEILLQSRYQLAFLKGDTAQMAQLARPPWESRARKTCCWPRKRTRKAGTEG